MVEGQFSTSTLNMGETMKVNRCTLSTSSVVEFSTRGGGVLGAVEHGIVIAERRDGHVERPAVGFVHGQLQGYQRWVTDQFPSTVVSTRMFSTRLLD